MPFPHWVKVVNVKSISGRHLAVIQKDRTLGQSLAALKVMMHGLDLCDPYVALPLKRVNIDEEQIILEQMRNYNFNTEMSIG